VGGKDSKTSSQQQQGGTKLMDQKRKQLLWTAYTPICSDLMFCSGGREGQQDEQPAAAGRD
jgi:hypothetical protein